MAINRPIWFWITAQITAHLESSDRYRSESSYSGFFAFTLKQ
jgi:hypothetical protein